VALDTRIKTFRAGNNLGPQPAPGRVLITAQRAGKTASSTPRGRALRAASVALRVFTRCGLTDTATLGGSACLTSLQAPARAVNGARLRGRREWRQSQSLGPDYPAVVRIVPATHGVAFLEGPLPWRSWLWAESSYAAAVASYGAADVMVRFLLQASAKMLDQAWEAASAIASRGPAPAAGDAAGRSRCGARPSALTVARGAR
jgi:hypothetical protein